MDADADADLGLEPGTFAAHLAGRLPITSDLLRRAASAWPVSERDLLPIRDDLHHGVRICSLSTSQSSQRTLSRGGRPYYEYRDTAMTRRAGYRPEWIRMLQSVSDDDPDNPAVQWNRGHLLYQLTYFVGPVNFYHEWQGRRFCTPMNTGDSVWGMPFVPHSFAARGAAGKAHILALTYGAELLGDPQRDLALLGAEAVDRLALDPYDPDASSAALLRGLMRSKMTTESRLSRRSGVPLDRLASWCAGDGQPSWPERLALAEALGVSPRALLPAATAARSGVRVVKAEDADEWTFPDAAPSYRLTELAGDVMHPLTAALRVEPLAGADVAADLSCEQHQYLYVLDGAPVELGWEHGGTRGRTLSPGDSAYLPPLTSWHLGRVGGPADVLVLRVATSVSVEVRSALGGMPAASRFRYLDEDGAWYADTVEAVS
ncbi:XRE family transcriptional regulator [Micromonospora tulbaghiae]|uniref:XRE family transcriptional regulator n=1 Tax=Micromonospora tulbaghiae TaxID=479978 RepID=UPI0036C18BCA